MARIIGGIGASHSPTIGYAKDTNKDNDPGWKPIFTGFKVVQEWVEQQQIDVLFMIFNDHITSFFFDHYSPFALGSTMSTAPRTRAAAHANTRPSKAIWNCRVTSPTHWSQMSSICLCFRKSRSTMAAFHRCR